MLTYTDKKDKKTQVSGDQITAKSMKMIAAFIHGAYHYDREQGDDAVADEWIELIDDNGDSAVGKPGDYFFSENGGKTFSFMSADEFESKYKENYDPEKDGREDKYFEPETDTRHSLIMGAI